MKEKTFFSKVKITKMKFAILMLLSMSLLVLLVASDEINEGDDAQSNESTMPATSFDQIIFDYLGAYQTEPDSVVQADESLLEYLRQMIYERLTKVFEKARIKNNQWLLREGRSV
jgi:hypothetical protein